MCLALVASGSAAFAQVNPPPAAQPAKPATPAAPGEQPKPAPLQQPGTITNVDLTGQPSLIKHNEKGELLRPDIPPDEAALELIGMDASEKEAVTQLLTARSAILDHVLSENLPLLLKFQGISSDDTQKEQMQALKDLITKAMNPLRDMGSLRDQVAPLLAPPIADRYKAILADYWAAVSQEDSTKKARGQPMTPEQIRGMETMLSYGQEIRRSYDRKVEAQIDRLPAMVAAAKPTAEQQEKIKAATDAYVTKGAGKPTASNKRELFTNVLKDLNYDQRIAVLGQLYGETKAAGEPKGK
jgi:hypothetical protein